MRALGDWRKVAALIGAVAALYGIAGCNSNRADLSSLARGEMAKLEVPAQPRAAPRLSFTDATGRSRTLADYRGQVVVLNFWATWCAPCRRELPSLGRLQTAYAGRPVQVIALSVDRDQDLAQARTLLATAPPLALFRDPGYRIAFGLDPRIGGFPTTVIYDRQGRERARIAADVDWAGADARAVIDAVLAQP
jgi:thiol-disulfide isomerase/thioredoxin